MIRLIIGICIGAFFTAGYYEATGVLSDSRQIIETKVQNQYPNLKEALASLSETGVSINTQEIVPTFQKISANLLGEPSPVDEAEPFYYVQVGAFTKREDGEKLKANLLLKGFLNQHIYVEKDKYKDLNRVLIGPYVEKGKAIMSLSWAHKNKFDGLIVRRSRI